MWSGDNGGPQWNLVRLKGLTCGFALGVYGIKEYGLCCPYGSIAGICFWRAFSTLPISMLLRTARRRIISLSSLMEDENVSLDSRSRSLCSVCCLSSSVFFSRLSKQLYSVCLLPPHDPPRGFQWKSHDDYFW